MKRPVPLAFSVYIPPMQNPSTPHLEALGGVGGRHRVLHDDVVVQFTDAAKAFGQLEVLATGERLEDTDHPSLGLGQPGDHVGEERADDP